MTWQSVNDGVLNFGIQDIVALDNSIFVAQANEIFVSFNDGNTWSNVSNGIGSTTINALAVDSEDQAVFAGNNILYKTINNGLTWQPITGGGLPTQTISSITIFSETIYVGFSNGQLWRSINDGQSWNNLTSNLSGSFVRNVIQLQNGRILTSTNNGIFASDNNGITWQLKSPTFNFVGRILRMSETVLTAPCLSGSIFSFNDGETWFLNNDGLSVTQLSSLFYDGNFLFAGVNQSQVHRRPSVDIFLEEDTCSYSLYDTINVTQIDTVTFLDTITTNVFDTLNITLVDTFYQTIFDTVSVSIIDTQTIVIYDTIQISVYDTLVETLFDTTFINFFDTTHVEVIQYDTILTSVTDTLVINTLITTNDTLQEITVKLYPNPASTILYIELLDWVNHEGLYVKIENILGQTVFYSLFDQEILTTSLSSWGSSSGLFFLKLFDENDNLITIKNLVVTQ